MRRRTESTEDGWGGAAAASERRPRASEETLSRIFAYVHLVPGGREPEPEDEGLFFYGLTVLLTLLAAAGVVYEHGLTLLLLALLIAVQTAALFVFHHYVLKPLAHVHAATRQMTDGHLDILARIARQDEIGRLGESINDLAVNMQEVLLFVWNHSQQSRELFDQTAERLAAPEPLPTIQDNLKKMRQNNEDLKAIVLSFSYFEIRLEHERMLAESDCGNDGQG